MNNDWNSIRELLSVFCNKSTKRSSFPQIKIGANHAFGSCTIPRGKYITDDLFD